MQKYFITDGKHYVKQSKGRYVTCTSPVMADVFPLNKAQKILENSLCKVWKDKFYLEGEDDFTVITAIAQTEFLISIPLQEKNISNKEGAGGCMAAL